MLLGLLLLQLGWASDDGFEVIRTANDCVFEARAKAHSERPLRATAIGRMSTRRPWANWSRPTRTTPTGSGHSRNATLSRHCQTTLVYQRQQIMTLADREVLLWMTEAKRVLHTQWLAANEKPLELSPGAIRTPKNTGFWLIDAHPDGGSSVKHEVAVNAGGAAIPEFLLNWLRYKGFVSIIKDVRKHASQKK